MKIYLACPYSHQDPKVREHRFNTSCNVSASLLKEGHVVISPISMSHPIAISNDLPLTFEFWQKQNHEFIRWCEEVYVLTIDGWKTSNGIKDEIEFATEIGRKVRYIIIKNGGKDVLRIM